ncbi:MAG: hypothetical protein GEU90_03910 [Gemmatimonas sp.]|nr:hypothetical protein [Gemmatimonas sp.]
MQCRIVMLVAIFGLTGCEPEASLLPSGPSGMAARTITTSGGRVDSPEGAAIHFRQGSLEAPQRIRIESTSPPAELASAGKVVSAAFGVGPDGLALGQSATLALKFDREIDPSKAWLATIVGVANGLVQPYGATRVDLSSGVVEGDVGELGTFAVVIPGASMIFPVHPQSTGRSSIRAAVSDGDPRAMTDSITVFCGGSATPCIGTAATASENLLARVRSAALLYPAMAGSIRLADGAATGSISISVSLRLQPESRRRAETIWLNAQIQPTGSTVLVENPDEILLTDVRVRTTGGLGLVSGSNEEISTLVVARSSEGGLTSIGRSFRIPGAGGQVARVTIQIPVRLHS